MRLAVILWLLTALPGAALADEPVSPPTHAIAMHGAPALSADFAHLPYVDPQAAARAWLSLAYLGAFDSLNPYNVSLVDCARADMGLFLLNLAIRSADEPFTLYGLIAKSIETDDARDRIVFHLDPAAHFSDGSKISAADVLFTFNLLKTKGLPSQRAAYALVSAASRRRTT